MKLKKERNLNPSFLFSRILNKTLSKGFVLVAVIFFFFVFSVWGVINVYELKSREQGIKEEITAVKQKNKKIEMEIKELKNNKQYISSLAREKLNMVKKGELVFKFIPKKTSGNAGKSN